MLAAILTAQHLAVGMIEGDGHKKLAWAIRRQRRHVHNAVDRGRRTPINAQRVDADGDLGDGRRREQLLADPLTVAEAHIDSAVDDELVGRNGSLTFRLRSYATCRSVNAFEA